MNLEQIAQLHGADKYEHHYCPYYEQHIGRPRTLLEIGIAGANSLLMWEQWLPNTRIIGVDIVDNAVTHAQELGLEAYAGDAKDPHTYEGWLPDDLDVVVDDGSHHPNEILGTFDILWPKLQAGGWYVIEDLATVWDPNFDGGPDGGATMSLLRDVLDRTIYIDQDIQEFHAYEQIVFIKKAVPGYGNWKTRHQLIVEVPDTIPGI